MSSQETDMQDEQQIPILRDMVSPDDIQFSKTKETAISSETDDRQKNLDTLREELRTRVRAELQPVISNAINAAVEQASGEIKQVLLDELQGTLQNRIRVLIDDALDEQMGK